MTDARADSNPVKSPPWLSPLLQQLAVPVMGCTEPASIALAAALATDAARGQVPDWIRGGAHTAPGPAGADFTLEHLQVLTIPSLFKNALAVGIPNTGGGSGIYLAAALGPYLDPGAGINLLKGIDPASLHAAREMLGQGLLGLAVHEHEADGVFVEAQVIGVFHGERHVGAARLVGRHDRVVLLRRDGRKLYERDERYAAADPDAMAELARFDLQHLMRLAQGIDAAARAHVLAGVQMNREAARIGIERRLGLGVGGHLRSLQESGALGEDVPTQASLLAAGATDARMSGHDVEIMSSSGSGNQGIMAVLPVAALAEAAALSHLVTGVMTRHTGLLSALCGCVVKAGLGAAAGCAYALGLDAEGVLAALKNMAGNQTGEICDGAKVGCAVKLSTAARAAVLSAYQARDGLAIPADNGILAATAEDLFSHIGEVARSMREVDRTIVDLMERKQLHLSGAETSAG